MSELVHRLAAAYQRQRELYGEVLALSRDGLMAVREGEPLEHLHRLNEAKRERLARIEQVERDIALDKSRWFSAGRPLAGSVLDDLLRDLSGCIETILRTERETDLAVLAASGIGEAAERSA